MASELILVWWMRYLAYDEIDLMMVIGYDSLSLPQIMIKFKEFSKDIHLLLLYILTLRNDDVTKFNR